MIRWLLTVGLALLLAAGGFLYWKLQPEDHADYIMRKELHGERGKTKIVWNAMPVEQAYQTVAKARTPFRAEISIAPLKEAEYLAKLFGLTDAAVAERVAAQAKFGSGAFEGADLTNYDAILGGLLGLETPVRLIPVEVRIHDAVVAHQRYLEAWRAAARPDYFDPEDPLVQSAHEDLSDAYQALMKLYGAEQQQNKRAFYDHLAALDFI